MINTTVTTVDDDTGDDEHGHDLFTATHKMNDAPGAGTTCPWMPGPVPGSGRSREGCRSRRAWEHVSRVAVAPLYIAAPRASQT
jgi:hypothetical protein